MNKNQKELNHKKRPKKTVNYWELLQTYKLLLIIPILLFFIFYRPQPTGFLASLLDKLKFFLGTIIWASLGGLGWRTLINHFS